MQERVFGESGFLPIVYARGSGAGPKETRYLYIDDPKDYP